MNSYVLITHGIAFESQCYNKMTMYSVGLYCHNNNNFHKDKEFKPMHNFRLIINKMK